MVEDNKDIKKEISEEKKVEQSQSTETSKIEQPSEQVKETGNEGSKTTPVAEEEEKEVDIKDLQLKGKSITKDIDLDSHLFSDIPFEHLGIRPDIIKALYNEMKFVKPTDVQAQVLPAILDNPPKNVIAQSRNGTGKTACFSIGILSRVNPRIPGPQAICLCTTREIANQTFEVIKKIGTYTPITYQLAVRQERDLNEEEHVNVVYTSNVIVGTVGTIIGAIQSRRLDLRNICVIVIDEADEMLKSSEEFGPIMPRNNRRRSMLQDARNIIVKAKQASPQLQLLLFSATFKESVFKFIRQSVVGDAILFRKKDAELKLSNVPLYYIECKTDQDKKDAFRSLYHSMTVSQALIFANEVKTVEELWKEFNSRDLKCERIHSHVDPFTRDTTIKLFKEGKIKVLLCTNVLARGFDCSSVTLVVNYDVPYDDKNRSIDYENFLHRVGRTGRMGKKGIAITFIKDQVDMKCLEGVEQKYDMKMVNLDPDDTDQIEAELDKCTQYNKSL